MPSQPLPVHTVSIPSEGPNDGLVAYFWSLHAFSLAYLDTLEVGESDDPVVYTERDLQPRLVKRSEEMLPHFPEPRFKVSVPAAAYALPSGLNTVGSLLDRLSICAVKEWYLRNGPGDASGAEALRAGLTTDIVTSLAMAIPDRHPEQPKVTAHRSKAEYASLAEAYCDLMEIHVCFWEKQELSYGSRTYSIPLESYKRFVKFGVELNVRRAHCQFRAAQLYWDAVLAD